MNIPLISIGNSKGIRIPQPILKQCNMGNEIEMEVRDGEIILRKCIRPDLNRDFDNIAELDDMTVQLMLRQSDPSTLALALVNAAEAVKAKILANMSERAGKALAAMITRFEALDARGLIVEMNRSIMNQILDRVSS